MYKIFIISLLFLFISCNKSCDMSEVSITNNPNIVPNYKNIPGAL